MAGLPLRVTKRGIQIALGVLWLIDGVLQLQPQMFTANFANKVIAPAIQYLPGALSVPPNIAVHVVRGQPILFDAMFALIQLALGALILWKQTTKAGLIGSAVWGIVVWYAGEGLGGLLNGQASLLMGAPGAALIYVVLALAVLPGHNENGPSAHERPAYWLPLAWALFWTIGAIYQLLPGQNSIQALSSMITGMATGAPSWLAGIDTWAGNTIAGQGFWLIGVLAALQLAIGLLVLVPGLMRKVVIGLGIVLSLVFWVIGQNLGAYYTGLATDPNAAPLFILLGVAILGCTPFGARELLRQLDHDVTEKVA